MEPTRIVPNAGQIRGVPRPPSRGKSDENERSFQDSLQKQKPEAHDELRPTTTRPEPNSETAHEEGVGERLDVIA